MNQSVCFVRNIEMYHSMAHCSFMLTMYHELHSFYYSLDITTQCREHLKPGIIAQLANAELYCSALANIYGDPNFHSLSHWKVIQALARKGVYVAEPTDVALNETVLMQDSPIKMVRSHTCFCKYGLINTILLVLIYCLR